MTGGATGLRTANLVALLVPALLLAGAWGSQLVGGLVPCEMCHWQRWPHYAALVLAGAAFLLPAVRRPLVLAAALAIAVSGIIGVLHAGVEYHWWQGFTACTSTVDLTGMDADQRLRTLLAAPMVRCDQAQWTLGGVSLAGFNAIFSLAGASVVTWLATMRRTR